MAVSTFTDVYARVRQRLGDDEITGGQIFTDTYLSGLMVNAWADLIRAFTKWSLPYTEKESFCYVQPYQDYVNVTQSGLPNPGEILEVWSCIPSLVQSVPLIPAPSVDPITGFVRLVPFDISGFASGDRVGVVMDQRFFGVANDTWTVLVDGIYLVLQGCFVAPRAAPDYAGALPGYVFKAATSAWRCLTKDNTYDPSDRTDAHDQSQLWSYRGQAIRLNPSCSQAQVLSVTYRISGDSSFVSSDSPVLGDDTSSFLTEYVCGLASQSKGQPGAEAFFVKAVGNQQGLADGEGGVLGEMIAVKVKEMQSMPQYKARFRVKNFSQRIARGWGGAF